VNQVLLANNPVASLVGGPVALAGDAKVIAEVKQILIQIYLNSIIHTRCSID
jgi:hypothetical protein